jgi:hypothetical protein
VDQVVDEIHVSVLLRPSLGASELGLQMAAQKDVRRFILEHHTDIDLRKTDQLWFIDLLAAGLRRAV